jgi:hypothetical protein
LIETSPSRQDICVDFSAVSKSLIWSQPGTNPGEFTSFVDEHDEISKVAIAKIEIFFT